MGSPPPAGGPLEDVRGGRHQHRRGVLQRAAPDGQEPLRDRGGGHAVAEDRDQSPALDRLGVRRVPSNPERRLAREFLSGWVTAPTFGALLLRMLMWARRSCPSWRVGLAGLLAACVLYAASATSAQ